MNQERVVVGLVAMRACLLFYQGGGAWWREPVPRTKVATDLTRVAVLVAAALRRRPKAWGSTQLLLSIEAPATLVGSAPRRGSGGKGILFSMGVLGDLTVSSLLMVLSLEWRVAPGVSWA